MLTSRGFAWQASRCQHAFSKPCLVNLISKDTHLVFSIFILLPVYFRFQIIYSLLQFLSASGFPVMKGLVLLMLLFNWIYRGSYMSAHVLLNLLNELGKRDKMRGSFMQTKYLCVLIHI